MTAGLILPTILPPEARLILACATTQRKSENIDQIRLLVRHDLDWPFILHQSELHHVVPLLYASLRAAVPTEVPAVVMTTLQQQSLQTAQRNLYLTRQLIAIMQRLSALDIPSVSYKGPLLAAQAYGNVSLRQFIDLDILIRRSDFARAKAALQELHYQPLYQHSLQEERSYIHIHHDYPFVRVQDRIIVELQWAIVSRHFWFPLGYDEVESRLESFLLAGSRIQSINLEQQLLLLCVHGSKHRWRRLAWICDIAEVVHRHPSLDWPWLLDYANKLGGRRMLALGLLLAQRLFDIKLPVQVERSVAAERQAQVYADNVIRGLFDAEVTPNETVGHRRLYYVGLMGRLADRFRLTAYYYRKTAIPFQALRRHGLSTLKRVIGIK